MFMGWFHTNLSGLKKTLSEIEHTPTPVGINKFHDEIAQKLVVLKKELEDTQYLVSDAQFISNTLKNVEATFREMLFLRGEVETFKRKALQGEIQHMKTNIQEISAGLDNIRERIGSLEKVVQLVKIEEEIEER